MALVLFVHDDQAEPLQYWNGFVARFFAAGGRMRYRLVNSTTNEIKTFGKGIPMSVQINVFAKYYLTFFFL